MGVAFIGGKERGDGICMGSERAVRQGEGHIWTKRTGNPNVPGKFILYQKRKGAGGKFNNESGGEKRGGRANAHVPVDHWEEGE